MAVTLRFQSTGRVPGNAGPAVLRGPSLTIGRGDENDVVLPDPDRLISKRHCVIEDRGGSIYAIDFSANGTFLNYGKVPLGTTPTPLNDGDILTMGPYELLVEIAGSRHDPLADAPPPLEERRIPPGRAAGTDDLMSLLDGPGADQGFLDELLGAPARPGGPGRVRRADLADDGLMPPLGGDDDLLPPLPDPAEGQGASRSAHSPAQQDHFRAPSPLAGSIPDDWDDLLDGIAPPGGGAGSGASGGPQNPFADPGPADDLSRPAYIPDLDEEFAPAAPPLASPAMPVAQVQPVPAIMQGNSPAATPAMHPVAASDTAARAFLSALGAGKLPVTEAELVPTLSRMGHVLRVMIQGVREVLMTRSSIKSEFRIVQTMIASGGNNPLKFSISPEQAVEAMVKPSTPGYLDATEATEQALRDIKAHEIAMMTGMEAALKGVLQRLSPQALEGKIETNGGIGSILKGKKARYWEVYEKMYEEISDQAENDFHELFSREFARAYQNQLERLK